MESLDPEGLALCLKGHLDPGLIFKLKFQSVDGSTFLNLSPQTLILFGFTLCEVTSISLLLKNIQDGKVSISKTSEDQETPSSGISDIDMNIDISGSENLIETESNCDDDGNVSVISKRFQPLLEFVDEEVLLKHSEFELVNMLGKLQRWQSVVDNGLPHSHLPSLGCKLKSIKSIDTKSTPGPKNSNEQIGKANSKQAKSSTKSHDSNTNQSRKQPIRNNKRKLEEKDSSSQSGAQVNSVSNGSKRKFDVKQSTSQGNIIRPDESMEDQSDSSWKLDDNSGHNSETSDSAHSTIDFNDEKENLMKPTFDMLSTDELLAIQPSLPSFDVENILLADDKAKIYVPALKQGYLLPSKTRKMVFRILTRHLINNHARNIKEVTSLMKHGMAKSIVVTYRQYQSPVPVASLTPWAHIYNPKYNSGHLANIIKRAQTSLPLADRARKGKQKKTKKNKRQTTASVNVEALAIMMPDREHREEIFDGMEKTFEMRCEDREKGLSITSIIEKFPQFLNFSGELISLEFRLQYPKAEDMCVFMTPLIPKIIDKWNDRRLTTICTDRTLRACMLLASRLPHAISRRMHSAVPQEEELIVIVNRGIDLEKFVMEKREKTRKAIQPYILAVRGQVTTDLLRQFLVLDSNLLELPKVPLLRAIDILFKSFIVFNVHYPQTWQQFFRFLQTCVYKFMCSKKDVIPPSSIELYGLLTSL